MIYLYLQEKQYMKLKFCSLSSGSSGNCYYLGNEFHGILIDAGISAGAIRKFLKTMDISFESIVGVLVTHNHSDHIKGLEVLTRNIAIPIYTTQNIWESIISSPTQHKITDNRFQNINLHQNLHLAGFDIEAFPVFHDAPETIGFHIKYKTHKITIVTDLGHICDTAASYIKAANFLVIESNYDEQMLQTSSYPYFLKERIFSNNGHLSNDQTSTFIADYFPKEISHICLAHLSKNNNSPEKAFQTLQQTLINKGIPQNKQPKIVVLNRISPTEIIHLGN